LASLIVGADDASNHRYEGDQQVDWMHLTSTGRTDQGSCLMRLYSDDRRLVGPQVATLAEQGDADAEDQGTSQGRSQDARKRQTRHAVRLRRVS
jgi:hypothetical protein